VAGAVRFDITRDTEDNAGYFMAAPHNNPGVLTRIDWVAVRVVLILFAPVAIAGVLAYLDARDTSFMSAHRTGRRPATSGPVLTLFALSIGLTGLVAALSARWGLWKGWSSRGPSDQRIAPDLAPTPDDVIGEFYGTVYGWSPELAVASTKPRREYYFLLAHLVALLRCGASPDLLTAYLRTQLVAFLSEELAGAELGTAVGVTLFYVHGHFGHDDPLALWTVGEVELLRQQLPPKPERERLLWATRVWD
jgi:hypothetical protein